MTPDFTADQPARGRRLGDYELLELTSPGCYRARDTRSGRTVALTIVPGSAPAGFTARVHAARALNHPNVCSVYGLEEADGVRFVTMEFVEGDTLQAVSRNGLPFDQVLVYARQLADALAYLHREGIVHGALSSTDVKIAPGGSVKLLECGIASDTPLPYVAPEQLRGAAAEPASDVWAFGVLLWEITTSELPFTGRTDFDIRSAILYSALVSPPLAWPSPFTAIVFRCLARTAEARYRDGAALSDALKSMPLTTADHARSWARTAAIGGGALAAILGVLAIVVFLVIGKSERPGPQVDGDAAAVAPLTPSLAILPLKAADSGSGDATLQLGVADALITATTGLQGVTVRPSGAVFRYLARPGDPAAAGRALSVETVLDGALLKSGSQLRITTRLVHVADGRMMWTHDFTGSSNDLVAMQGSISRELIEQLLPGIDGATVARRAGHGTTSSDALLAYMTGQYQRLQHTEDAAAMAAAAFERATMLDGHFAAAFAGLADSRTALGLSGSVPAADTFEKAKRAATQAVLLDDGLAEAHASLALVHWLYDWNWDLAGMQFERSLELNPDDAVTHQWYARFLASRRRFAEAQSEIQRARALDPLSDTASADAGEINLWARQYDLAVSGLRRSADRNPNFAPTQTLLGLAYILQRHFAEGITSLERARQLDGGPHVTASLVYGYAASGNRPDAESLLDELDAVSKQRYVSPFEFAVAYAGLGDAGQALAWLERAFQERAPGMVTMAASPSFDVLRDDQRYRELLQRVETASRQ